MARLSSGVATRTSSPAARQARAKGTSGPMCPAPRVEQTRTRTAPLWPLGDRGATGPWLPGVAQVEPERAMPVPADHGDRHAGRGRRAAGLGVGNPVVRAVAAAL